MKNPSYLPLRLAAILYIATCILPPGASAAPMAWLINVEGQAVKLDLSRNVVVATKDLGIDQILVEDIAVDRPRGNVFAPNGRGPYEVTAPDLRTLADKGALDFVVDQAPTAAAETIRFVFPPTGGEFFARMWNDGTTAFEIATINSTTLTTTARRTSSPPAGREADAGPRQADALLDDGYASGEETCPH